MRRLLPRTEAVRTQCRPHKLRRMLLHGASPREVCSYCSYCSYLLIANKWISLHSKNTMNAQKWIKRRLLKKLKLDQCYPGKKRLDGNLFKSHVANVRWKAGQKIYRPFKCLLDIGLARSSTGARVFGALKGAVDGGLDIPHSEKRFPGFIKGKGNDKGCASASVWYGRF